MIGTTIGHYRIVGRLGRGGSGTVYKALDEILNRDVAIKVLNPDAADPDAMGRFRAEASILAKLNHPQIATIYELFQSEAGLLMVMELVCGETLDALSARQGALLPTRAAYLVDQILSAVKHAHGAGVVHRDLKPSNVMVTTAGIVKVMDFGIARIRGAERLTVDGSMVGTPAYMAPEQVLGQEIDGRADLYSVGVIFYRLLTAALPFEGDTPVAIIQHRLADMPIPLSDRRNDLPGWCDAIVQRSLAKAPTDRFQSAEEFRKSLLEAVGIVPTTDLAEAFVAAERQNVRPLNTHVSMPTVVLADGTSPEPDVLPGKPVASMNAAFGRSTTARMLGRLKRHWYLAGVGALIGLAAAFITVKERAPAAPQLVPRDVISTPTVKKPSAPEFSDPLMFQTRVLVGNGRKQRERDARLVLAAGSVTVTTDDDDRRTVRAVPYDHVMSISYSHGRDPMWLSPAGPARVAHVDGGLLRSLRVPVTRHWVSLGTSTPDHFVVIGVAESQVHVVLSALEKRTGVAAERIGRTESRDDDR
jgi:serine/threonine protein kinase